MHKRKTLSLAALGAVAFSLFAAAPSHAAGSIAWKSSLDSGLAEAKRTGKPVLVYFWATWCGPCKVMLKNVYPKASVVKESKKWVMIKLDYDKSEKVIRKYKVSANMPQFLFMTPGGKVVSKTQGYQTDQSLLGAMRGAYRKAKQ